MNDDDLRARFAELKAADRHMVPRFARMSARPQPARSSWSIVVPSALLAAAAGLVLWYGAHTMVASPPAARAPLAVARVDSDPAPLDFLLEPSASFPQVDLSVADEASPMKGW